MIRLELGQNRGCQLGRRHDKLNVVGSGAAIKCLCARRSNREYKLIVTGSAIVCAVAVGRDQRIGPAAAIERIVAAVAIQNVSARVTGDDVGEF